ncbi:MAG TPA: Sir2 family NAD-dependent protein deacetylase [Thermoanaerobaculia bacterium]
MSPERTFDLGPLRPFYRRLRDGGLLGVLTGAGVSAESGLPPFHGTGSLWEGTRTERLETAEGFTKDPERIWRYTQELRRDVGEAQPNGAHMALAQLQRLLPQVRVVTLNVDGLHQLAGSREVVELHGSLLRARCILEGTVTPAPVARRFDSLPPYCPECGGLLRPDVVWFGESLPPKEWEAAEDIAERSTLFLVVGTSSVVDPASMLGIAAARGGSAVYEVDLGETPPAPLLDGVFRGKPSEVLSALAREIGPR